MAPTATLIVLSSSTAYIDPSVQVHAAGCPHLERRCETEGVDRDWESARCESVPQARRVARAIARRIGAPSESWMDCTLFGAA